MRMDEQEARLILQAYRPGEADKGDPHFDEALKEAARNPALARWRHISTRCPPRLV